MFLHLVGICWLQNCLRRCLVRQKVSSGDGEKPGPQTEELLTSVPWVPEIHVHPRAEPLFCRTAGWVQSLNINCLASNNTRIHKKCNIPALTHIHLYSPHSSLGSK